MNRFTSVVLFGGAGAATPLGDFGLLILRLGTGLFMAIGHGRGKLWHDGPFGPGGMVDMIRGLGFPMPTFFAWAVALTEFLGGLLLAAGLLTRPVATFLVINMAVAAFKVHAKDPFFAAGPGANKEFALLYLLPFLMFVFTGAGRFSVDAQIRRK